MLIAMVSLISYDISPAGSRFTFLRLIYISLFFFIFCFILLRPLSGPHRYEIGLFLACIHS